MSDCLLKLLGLLHTLSLWSQIPDLDSQLRYFAKTVDLAQGNNPVPALAAAGITPGPNLVAFDDFTK